MADGNAPAEARVVFFGDSIAVGQHVERAATWVDLVSKDIRRMPLVDGVRLVPANRSVNGNTTRQALERMPKDVQADGVAVLFIQFGLNDCNYWVTDAGGPRVSKAAFRANLCEIIERGQRFGARAVLLNTNHPTSRGVIEIRGAAYDYEAHNREYNVIVREVSEAYGGSVLLVDSERHLDELCQAEGAAIEDFLLDDGIHLNERGHAVYYGLMRPRVISCCTEALTNKV